MKFQINPTTRSYKTENKLKQVDAFILELFRKHKRVLEYDDSTAEFYGGAAATLTRRNYEKGLGNIWKAECVAPSLGIKDATKKDKQKIADTQEIDELLALIPDFKQAIHDNFYDDERKALARILSVILHGEVYALAVSASLIGEVQGTGAKLGLAMQTMEEAKHFIVMREIVRAIDKVYPQNLGEFLALERILAAAPMDRLFGMNLVAESIALTFFGVFSNYPGLEDILPFFHKDEARHSAFPKSYTQEFPLDKKHKTFRAKQRRTNLVLPLLWMITTLKEDADVLGIDIFDFGGKIIDKVGKLSVQCDMETVFPRGDLIRVYNVVFNAYMKKTDPEHYKGFVDYGDYSGYKLKEGMKEREIDVFGLAKFVPGDFSEKIYNKLRRKL